jgi:hypothetical protein
MKRYLGTILCVLSAAACSTNKPPADASSSAQTTTATTTEPALTPASSYEDHKPAGSTETAHPAPAPKATGDHHDKSTLPANTNAANPEAPVDTMPPPATADANKTQPAAPDNTKVNKRDTNAANTPTPIDQKENRTDLNITQQIRKAVVADGSLSFTAKNVKIITANGKVTLRGPVKTAEERAAIEAMATRIVGAGNVDNQLEVK